MANSVVNQIKVGSTTYDIKPYLGSATSGDAASATAWTAVDAVATSDSYDTVFNKVTKMVKNVRYLYNKIGIADFSALGADVSNALTTLNTNKAASNHNHDTVYAAKSHSHSNYSTTGHTHSNYSTTGHTHSNYASSTHNHDTAYAAKSHTHSDYSTTGHTHSNYSTTGHTHSGYSTTGHTHSYIATSNIVTSQTNNTSKVPAASLLYSMNDTLNTISSNVSTGKSSIATAITNKGVSTSSSDTWATMASNIGQLGAKGSKVIYTSTLTTNEDSGITFNISLTSLPTNFIATVNGTGTSTGRTIVCGFAKIGSSYYANFVRSYSMSYIYYGSWSVSSNVSYQDSKKLVCRYIDSGYYYAGGTWILVYWN